MFFAFALDQPNGSALLAATTSKAASQGLIFSSDPVNFLAYLDFCGERLMQYVSEELSDWGKQQIHKLESAAANLWNDDGDTAVLTADREDSTGTVFPTPLPTVRLEPFISRPSTALPPIQIEGNLSSEYQLTKRALDIVGALAFFVLFSPVLLTVLIVLTITTRGKPLFSQERIGQGGRRFRMFKFRTMRLDADKLQHLVQNEKDGPIFKNRCDPRVTRLGRWLRKTSIDELPQLLSVLLGDMSLVGPRPPVLKEVVNYKPWQRRRLAVKPGLTCKWQVSGRSDVGFEDWVRMDIWYVRNQTLWTDLKLLVRTPLTVILCKGAY
jgi:lipopolysaccharide/colanic/teichoic acid biosynthesis glycosyltransferase